MIRTQRTLIIFGSVALSLALLSGCASEPPQADTPGDDDVALEEPVTGLPETPPLGAPRPKVTPGELIVEENDD